MENNNAKNTIPEISHEVTIYAEPIFNIGSFQVTNSLLTSWLAVVVVLLLTLAIRLKLKKIPGMLQNMLMMKMRITMPT